MIHYKVSDVELLYASKENSNQNYHYTDKCLQQILMLISSIKKWYVLDNKMKNDKSLFSFLKTLFCFCEARTYHISSPVTNCTITNPYIVLNV